jgi:YegS/Rv2252/BmrU family lipid kinase
MARKRVVVVFNPTAGSARNRRFSKVLAELRRLGVTAEVTPTACRGDAERIVGRLRAADWDAVAVAGGDGTIDESVNGLHADSPPLAIVPLGTANVAAWEIGLGLRPDRVAAAIASGPARDVHVGRVNGRRFLLMAGIGFDAQVVRDLPPALKRALGKGAYGWQTLATLAAYRYPVFRVEVDGAPFDAVSAVIANGRFYAGRYSCAPAARLADPLLHVCLFERPGTLATLGYAARLLSGRLRPGPGYRVVTGRRISIAAPPGAPVQADGDLAAILPVTVESTGETVRLIHPATSPETGRFRLWTGPA